MLILFTLGQYLAMYLPAFHGSQPQIFFLIISMLWTALLGLFGAKILSLKKFYGFALGLLLGAAAFAGALLLAGLKSANDTAPWQQSQLEHSYMQGLSKNQCLLKSVSFLESCDSDACLKTMSAVSTDCISVASGTSAQFCLVLAADQQLSCDLTATSGGEKDRICQLQEKLQRRFCQ
ncbi:MAG: hypothetical protein OFPI_43780 [Osedax symbiont Rs2]|nr:MAG: hypothetical protein OFPI_43780 [Osedax symbiont Rs2]